MSWTTKHWVAVKARQASGRFPTGRLQAAGVYLLTRLRRTHPEAVLFADAGSPRWKLLIPVRRRP